MRQGRDPGTSLAFAYNFNANISPSTFRDRCSRFTRAQPNPSANISLEVVGSGSGMEQIELQILLQLDYVLAH
jgi:hypothetical protein